jgi:hypothetical protein
VGTYTSQYHLLYQNCFWWLVWVPPFWHLHNILWRPRTRLKWWSHKLH